MKRLTLAAGLMLAAFAFPASALASSGNYAICHNGVLSDDVGQGCTNDGPYGGSPVALSGGNYAICHDGILSDDVGQGCTNDGPYTRPFSAISSTTSTPSTYSGGSSGGYCGGYQFDNATWHSVGMSGSACGASPAAQDEAAQRLYAQRGSEPWPHCGYLAPNWAALRQCENSGRY